MKRSVDFFRIKLILIAAIIVFPVVFIVTFIGTISDDFGDFEPRITYENAPENTAYVDILVKLPESSENYVDFAKWKYYPQRLVDYHYLVTEAVVDENGNVTTRTHGDPILEDISITPDSEIARLNDDGYVSLSVHYKSCEGFSDYAHLLLSEKMTIGEITRRYGKFKAAYVDENGSVLGITETSHTRYDPKKPSSFSADGDTLIFTKWGMTPLQCILLGASLLGEPLAVSALVVCNDHYKRQNKQPLSEEQIQG